MKNLVKVIEQDMITDYTREEWYGEPVYKQEDVSTFEIIPFSKSEQDYTVEDMPFYGQLVGLVMGFQFEARNVCDKRFPVGKLLYFSVHYSDSMPEAESEFMNFYAHDLGWELTGRVVFRGYATQHWCTEERDWYVIDATAEEIQMAREATEGWD